LLASLPARGHNTANALCLSSSLEHRRVARVPKGRSLQRGTLVDARASVPVAGDDYRAGGVRVFPARR
jgi:hypothetical protein